MPTLKQTLTVVALAFGVIAASAPLALAQNGEEVANAAGLQPGRNYYSQALEEHIDPLTGALVLQVTPLVLPGNAGHDLRFVWTYSSKSEKWAFSPGVRVVSVYEPDGSSAKAPPRWSMRRMGPTSR